ncbi:MAG: rhodanese-like domain-containing protein, partial [Aggregatilineales bacterium]
SACGKGIGSVPSTTLGYEQRFNPAFQIHDEDEFVAWLLEGQPEAPPYFARMKRVNRVSAPLLLELPQAQHIKESPAVFLPDNAMLIDTRPAHIFAHKHLPGSVNIPISSTGFSTWAGNLVADEQSVFFIAYLNDVMNVLTALYSVGIDNVPGYFTADILEQGETVSIPEMPPEAAGDEALIVDVRGAGEYTSEHIPDALNIPMPQLHRRIAELPQDRRILFQCQSGVRSQVVTSFLMSQGINNVATMPGGINAWRAADLPVQES